MPKDKHVKSVVKKFKNRSKVGIKKYGTTLERPDYFFIDWVTHLQEELMDASLYCEVLKSQFETLSVEELMDASLYCEVLKSQFETVSVDAQNVQESSVEPTIQSEVNQGISLSKEAAFENRNIYLKASWSKDYFYGIEITLKDKKDKKGENLTFYWDNDYWLYNLAIGDEEAIKSAQEDLTEREATFVRVFLKNLVDRGILKGKEEENINPF
jgi:hypothetical protein